MASIGRYLKCDPTGQRGCESTKSYSGNSQSVQFAAPDDGLVANNHFFRFLVGNSNIVASEVSAISQNDGDTGELDAES